MAGSPSRSPTVPSRSASSPSGEVRHLSIAVRSLVANVCTPRPARTSTATSLVPPGPTPFAVRERSRMFVGDDRCSAPCPCQRSPQANTSQDVTSGSCFATQGMDAAGARADQPVLRALRGAQGSGRQGAAHAGRHRARCSKRSSDPASMRPRSGFGVRRGRGTRPRRQPRRTLPRGSGSGPGRRSWPPSRVPRPVPCSSRWTRPDASPHLDVLPRHTHVGGRQDLERRLLGREARRQPLRVDAGSRPAVGDLAFREQALQDRSPWVAWRDSSTVSTATRSRPTRIGMGEFLRRATRGRCRRRHDGSRWRCCLGEHRCRCCLRRTPE